MWWSNPDNVTTRGHSFTYQPPTFNRLIDQILILQMHILSVSGPVVTVAGHGDQLAIVTHASDCLPSGDQVFVGMPICFSLVMM